jgi:GPI mannosyltransferase 4
MPGNVSSAPNHSLLDRVLDYPSSPTWEFTSAHPIRSVFPLWLVYGTPMYILRWLWQGFSDHEPPAWLVFYIIRGVMFMLSFVLEDWALHELVPIQRQRRLAIILIASSYVTWTWQTHTFSNAVETILVLWSLVLVGRITKEKVRISHPHVGTHLII